MSPPKPISSPDLGDNALTTRRWGHPEMLCTQQMLGDLLEKVVSRGESSLRGLSTSTHAEGPGQLDRAPVFRVFE